MGAKTADLLSEQARKRLYPTLKDPNYLVLSRRRKIFTSWIESRNPIDVDVLDVGGRIRPYKALLEGRTRNYVGVDIVESPFVNVLGSGEELPFKSETFDVVICTQVFEYFAQPAKAASEVHRVLKSGGIALLSFASFYPRAAEEEQWRFLRPGLQIVLGDFRRVHIVPEGSSIVGFMRACAVCLAMFAKLPILRGLVLWTVVPLLNLLGELIEHIVSTKNDQASGNYSVLAEK